ncbi:MAG: hypothetical protein KTR35_00365 [Gammaproteobacteria bacterium]|nr:hypothetical protein [Gammaproteobacteria bacterium]
MQRNFIKLVLLFLSISGWQSSAQELTTGAVYSCAKVPAFIETLGFEQPAIDTTITTRNGVVIRDMEGQQLMYQHNTWRQSGHVGITIRDAEGHMYLIPVPTIGLDTNPLERRNTIYRIDSNTGLMSTFIELPLSEEPSQANPFGTLGLAYDCDTNSLYVNSVAGSTNSEINGVIYQIDIATGKVVDQLADIDALGIGIFNTPNEKRLYYGDARSSNLMSVPLTEAGNFNRLVKPNYELSLLALKNGDSTQVRKIVFNTTRDNQHFMALSDAEFSFRMTAETARKYKIYNFQFSKEDNNWQLLSVVPQ